LKNALNKALNGHYWGQKHTFKKKVKTKGKEWWTVIGDKELGVCIIFVKRRLLTIMIYP
jgi:hypothetical protein